MIASAQTPGRAATGTGIRGLGWLLDFRAFARALVFIRNKEERTVRLVLNPMQESWLAQAGEARRTITLKARQHGISTMLEARMFHRACTRPGYRGAIIAQDLDTTQRLRSKIRTMYERMADVAPVPKMRYDSKSEMEFVGLESSLYIGTAGSRMFGRGDTLSEVHASELAFWPDPERLLVGLGEAVPAGGQIHIESTANGFNYFYQLCQGARAGENGYQFVFLPWYVNPEYVRRPGVPMHAWTDEERTAAATAARYGVVLSPGQVAFRREKQRDLKERFAQEYAEDAETAFLLSGRPRFDAGALHAMLAGCREPIKVHHYKDAQLTYRQWEQPQAGKFYVIGADAAQGISDRDYSCACVVDWATGTQVAEVHGRADPSVFADRLAVVGYAYHNAVINPERKESGIAVVSKLKELGYPRLFYYLNEGGKLADQPGFDTNTHTKPIAVEMVGELISDYPAAFVNREEVAELMRFVVSANGKTGAEDGAHDDRVAARWCAEVARRQVRPPREVPLARRPGLGVQV